MPAIILPSDVIGGVSEVVRQADTMPRALVNTVFIKAIPVVRQQCADIARTLFVGHSLRCSAPIRRLQNNGKRHRGEDNEDLKTGDKRLRSNWILAANHACGKVAQELLTPSVHGDRAEMCPFGEGAVRIVGPPIGMTL